MTAKLFEFMQERKIDERRLLVASKAVERLRPEDRQLKLARRQSKVEGASTESKPGKPRSGRPITHRLLNEVRAGKAISGPAKQRLLRALNHLLTQKKQDPVDLRALF